MRTSNLRSLFIAAPALLLVACSGGEPSASDIKAAYSKAVDKMMNDVRAAAGGNQAVLSMYAKKTLTIDAVEKMGDCDKNADGNYNCPIKVTATVMGAQRQKVDKVVLFLTSDGWQIKM